MNKGGHSSNLTQRLLAQAGTCWKCGVVMGRGGEKAAPLGKVGEGDGKALNPHRRPLEGVEGYNLCLGQGGSKGEGTG